MTEILFAKAGEVAGPAINTQSGSYTLQLSDDGGYVRMTNGGGANVTVPANATAPFQIGAVVVVRQAGAGAVTLVAGGGVTLNTPETLVLGGQHSSVVLVKVGLNAWDVSGDLQET